MNAAGSISYEQAGELKIGQVGIANLRVRTLDVDALVQEMRERVERAPKLFGRAAVILDFGGLSQVPEPATARALIAGLREAGVLPVALAYGTHETETLAEQLDLPLLARFRAQYERGEATTSPSPREDMRPRETASRSASRPAARDTPTPPPASIAPSAQPGLLHKSPVRSGQQVYAEDRDLTVVGMVSPAAEVISDGSIHIYGSLRGRALAGAKGNTEARIFCRDFRAELVAIAGHYKVLEDVPKELLGKPVQVWLENEQLNIALQE